MSNTTEQAALEAIHNKDNKLYKTRNTGNSYPEISAEQKRQMIAAAVAQQREALRNFDNRVDLRSMPQVQQRVEEYMQSCESYGTIPTMLGLAAYMGYSRRNLYAYIANHFDTDTAQYLDNFRSVSAAIIAQASANRTIDNATSIFLLKNSGQGLADSTQVEITRGIDPEPVTRAADIVEKWRNAGIELPE